MANSLVVEERRSELLSSLETQDFQQAASSATRLTSKLAAAVQKQELYETHQLLRTIYFRFINHPGKLKPLIDLLYGGARFLLANRETISGQDVATLCLESSAKLLQWRLDEAKSGVNKETIKALLTNSNLSMHREKATIDFDICSKIANLVNELPDTEAGRTKFFAEASKLLSPKILNRELLHTALAQAYKSQLEYVEARYHFLHCANQGTAIDIGELLAQYHHYLGNKNEVDLFLVQFVLQFLCMQSPSDCPPSGRASGNTSASMADRKTRATIRQTAELIIRKYKDSHHQLSNEPSPSLKYPLINFLNFIIAIIDATRLETQTFKTLCNIYKTSWDRDPNYVSYLNRIGVLYFGMIDLNRQQQQQQQGGFFNNILMSLMDASDDDDDAISDQESNTMASYDDLD